VRVIGYLQMRAVGAVTEGAGFADQEQQLRAWADRHGHDLVRTVVDRCSTGTAGPGLAAAVAAVQAGEADALAATSRARLDGHHPLGVRALVVNEPAPAATPAGPSRRSRGNVRAALGPWLAIAVATAVSVGVAAASAEEPPTAEGHCVSATYQTAPCNGSEMARVLRHNPPFGQCVDGDNAYDPRHRIWLCLRYR
jgi:hypothetical protein